MILNSGPAPAPATPVSFGESFAALRGSDGVPERYLQAAAGLRAMDPAHIKPEAARRALFLNLYNAMVLHGVRALGLRKSVWETPFFFRRVRYEVAGRVLSLNDIEHGILRNNRAPPYKFLPPFPPWDPRRSWVLPPDPRVHFALNCGAASCPPIRFYEPEKLDEQLEIAARGFIAAETSLDEARRVARASKILQWYRRDFGEVRTFLGRYLERDLRGWRLEFKPYNWSLEAKHA